MPRSFPWRQPSSGLSSIDPMKSRYSKCSPVISMYGVYSRSATRGQLTPDRSDSRLERTCTDSSLLAYVDAAHPVHWEFRSLFERNNGQPGNMEFWLGSIRRM